MYYQLLLIILSSTPFECKDIETFILQSKHEAFHFDLISNYQDYQNANYEVSHIAPINQQNSILPNYTITDLNTELTSREMKESLIGASQYNLQKYPITILLQNTSFVVIQFFYSDNQQLDFKIAKQFELKTLAPQIVTCTSIYGLFDEIVNIDCSNQDNNQFINVVATISFSDDDLDITFQIQYYQFSTLLNNEDLANNYWNNCLKKEIKYIYSESHVKRIFYCLSNQLNILQDQLIIVENSQQVNNEEIVIDVYVLSKLQFTQCNNEMSVDHFYIQQLIVNSITQNYSELNKWIFSLLLIDRFGICKCGNLRQNTIDCDFFELQPGQYTTLYTQSYSEEIQFIFVATETLLYKINYYFTYETDQDTIQGYFYIKQDGFQLSRIHIFYDFLLVIMTDLNNQNQTVLFYQKKFEMSQYLPNYIINTTTLQQIFRIDFDQFPGNYFLEYDAVAQNLGLHKLLYKHLILSYDQDVEVESYLLYQITLLITTPQLQFEDVYNLVVTQFNDPSFFAFPDKTQEQLTFKSEQFNYNLNNNLIGPLLNYHEIEWPYRVESTSLIEYIREIKIQNITTQFEKVFSATFVYNEVNALFTIFGSIVKDKQEMQLGFQQFKYEKTAFIEEGKLKFLKLESFQFKKISYVSLNLMTTLIGDQSTNNYIICFNNQFNQYSDCSKLSGDFLSEGKIYDYVHLNEMRCVNDTLFTIPNSRAEVIIFSISCINLNQPTINLTKTGVLDESNIVELKTQTIIDSQFEIIDNKLSFLLLSDGTIVQLITYYSITQNKKDYKIINRIYAQNCVPLLHNSSKIFIQFYQSKRVLVYICNENQSNQIIKEYDLQNPYSPKYVRRYALYQYVINNQLKPFNDQTVIYIPIENKVYLAYSPFFTSPNILLHAIPSISSQIISAVPVIVNNYNTEEWKIFSMAFFYDKFGGNLFYLNSNPVYYSLINKDVDQSQQMIMIYQQFSDFTIFKSFNVTFDYQETTISCSETIIINETTTNQVEIRLDDSIIKGAVQDIDIINLSDEENVIMQKNDILLLKQYVGNHFQALEFGKIYDILDMNQTEYFSIINSTAAENNLLFAVTQYYFIILEKRQMKSPEINRISILKQERLQTISAELFNLKQCKLSLNGQNEVLLYCFKYRSNNHSNSISKFALYYSITYSYDLENSVIAYKASPLSIAIGRRAQIEKISPIKFNGQIFQFIQYNFENSEDQYELICGKIENGSFFNKQIIQSSTFDYKILGQLSFDITLFNEEILLVLTLDSHELRVLQFIYDDKQLKKKREEKYPYSTLNESLFNSSQLYKLESISVLDCNQYACLVLLGVPEKFFEFHLVMPQQGEFKLIKQFTYVNYFRCIHSNQQKPQIELRENLQINQLVAACIKSDIEKNFFFEDKFDYFYDDILVFVQIFHRPDNTQESSPIRIYPFFFDQTTRERFHFILYIRQSDNQVHILFENDTYFLIDYLKQDSIYFVIQTNNTVSHKITGNLVLSNIRDKKVTNIEITFNFSSQTSLAWLYFLIGGIALGIVITLGVLMCLKARKRRKIERSQLSSKSIIDLDDVLKEVILGEGRRGSQTHLSESHSDDSN